jgi:hypothetical protein
MTPMQHMLLGVGAKKKVYLDDVFSNYLWTGDGASTRTITNNLDMSGEGALVWIKNRESTQDHVLADTVRGATKKIHTNKTNAEFNSSNTVKSFTSTGFTVGTNNEVNQSNVDYTSWSFRKAKGFFDIITYTGTGTSTNADGHLDINHSLASVPGMVIVKSTSGTSNWWVYHRGLATNNSKAVFLQSPSAAASHSSYWNGTAPTASQFTVGQWLNTSGSTYVAYVFAGGESTNALARSVEFDGAEDSLLIETNSDLALGTGDFTIEFWVKPQTLGYAIFFDMRPNPAATQGAYPTIFMENDILGYHTNSGTRITGNKLSKDQWQHIALSRSGTSTKMFVNGTQVGSTYSDSTNYLNGDTTIGIRADGSTGDFDGYISNVRVVKGTAVYTSSFRPPTEPLTNITNTKLLCCNNSSTTGSTVTPSTITATGTTASSDSPFDDPAGFKFGESGSENVIKCGSWKGNGSDTVDIDVHLGWEPTWLLVKQTVNSGNWQLVDSATSWPVTGNWETLRPNLDQAANDSTETGIQLTPTGFKVVKNYGNFNTDGDTHVFMAIRRPDGYVGKPVETATSIFAMDTGNGSSTIPTFDSSFPVDFALNRQFATGQSWYTNARMLGQSTLFTDTTATASNYSTLGHFDSNLGWAATGDSSAYQSWMWKRHAGFDVVAYEGNGVAGRQIRHNLSKSPEMIWTKNRDDSDSWIVGHKGLNGGTNPWHKYMVLNSDNSESDANTVWNDTAPTATDFTVGTADNHNYDGHSVIAMLFASTDVSKVGSYTGNGSSTGPTISLGFAPRLIIIKCANNGGTNWFVYDTLRGLSSGNEQRLYLNNANAQSSGNDITPSSTGFQLITPWDQLNANNDKYIYYAHA